jgi:hypothetical protein
VQLSKTESCTGGSRCLVNTVMNMETPEVAFVVLDAFGKYTHIEAPTASSAGWKPA